MESTWVGSERERSRESGVEILYVRTLLKRLILDPAEHKSMKRNIIIIIVYRHVPPIEFVQTHLTRSSSSKKKGRVS